jgi:protein-disulfide isomerase
VRLVMLLALVCACSLTSAAAQVTPSADVIAEVNGVFITNADLEEGLGQTLAKLNEQIYSVKRTRLDALIEDRLLALEAKARGMSTTALIETEITGKIVPVTDREVETFYETSKAKLQGDLTKWQAEIRTYLQGQRVNARRQAYLRQLREAAKVEVFLTPPPVFRATVTVDGSPARGAADAPVTIVEFSDFHCPFCRKVQPVLTELLSRYGDRVRLVYKDFPIDNLHPQARAAAEAARCAGEQGKFWEYHDRVYAGPTDGSPAALRAMAEAVGLILRVFDECQSSRKYQAAVQKDLQEGAGLGITGTPGFFINGRFLSGAQPIEAFVRVIEEELAAHATR